MTLRTSFKNYDSTQFPTFPESIAHARTNPLLIENLSDWRMVDIDNVLTKIQEPTCLLKDMLHFFDDVLEEEELPVEEYYRPEITAMRIYDCADMWYIILLLNNIFSVSKYNTATIRYIPPTQLTRIQKFTDLSNRTVRALSEDDMNDVIIK